jgi:glycosyltransferase involved in cell wall biosynthesis
MSLPFFSVVIPLYNRERIISKTIESVLKQTFQDFELIVVDDCSTDNSSIIIKQYQSQDARIRYFKNDTNQERCFSRNKGVKESVGLYICFLDSDDEFLPKHLKIIYDQIISSEIKKALFFTNSYQTFNFENLHERVCPKLIGYNVFEYILTYTFNPARVAIKSEILNEFKFDELIPGIEDLDLWLRIASKYPIFQIEDRTIIYNLHNESYSIESTYRFENELKMFHYVFSKPELKELLPEKSKKRLLSMCHYKLSLTLNNRFSPFRIHYHILKAFFLYPEGYNDKANKTMLVIFIDQIPLLGYLFKKIRLLKSMV